MRKGVQSQSLENPFGPPSRSGIEPGPLGRDRGKTLRSWSFDDKFPRRIDAKVKQSQRICLSRGGNLPIQVL